MAILLTSCLSDEVPTDREPEPKEVEISIATSANAPATRAPLDGSMVDAGDANENRIDELDLLVFDSAGKYLYRRQAYKLAGTTNTYRAMLHEYDGEMTIHFLANSRTMLEAWEVGTDKPTAGVSTWATVQPTLIDKNPARLVAATFVPLPMWGTGKVTLDTGKAPTKMGRVDMLRSVASFDLYVLDGRVAANRATKNFLLEDIYACYAANEGFIGAVEVTPATDPETYKIPATMKSSLLPSTGGTLRATNERSYTTVEGEFVGIAYQLFAYDNYFATVTGDNDKRPMRLIVAGKYDPAGNPAVNGTTGYYPVDIIHDDTKYRPVIRNWKYEFMVTSVSGPGLPSLEDARNAQNTDMNINIIQWNKDDVEIGVTGKYYVTMERRAAQLWRKAGASQTLRLDYRFLDNLTTNDFTFDFKKENGAYLFDNGPVTKLGPTTTAGVTTTTIRNSRFEVVMTQIPAAAGGGEVSFRITALQDYDSAHHRDAATVKYRNLEFEITIDQIDISEEDWLDGGSIPADI
ncbi:MAG: FimB/Mfa2 family fimbrial subunit [Alistipes sp.]|jgi:hypothetical protein|nr:FimB/Mfa2 family fimbrial subunit [Alistipes sp.]